MARKKPAVPAHDLDRIIVRLPPGMRDKVAALADANSRSLTAEVVAALDKHLKSADRITQIELWLEEYTEDVQEVSDLKHRLGKLEELVDRLASEWTHLSRSTRS
jgi:hypothetical protein